MDDAEAEAVLMALGPRLEWGREKYGTCSGRTPTGREYCVDRGMDRFNALFMVLGEAGQISPEVEEIEEDGGYYASMGAAKAACERHHATGK